MINGINYDYESIKVQLPSGSTILPENISYQDSKDDKVIMNKHGLPVGVGRGKYSGSGNMELGYADYVNFRNAVSNIGGFYNNHAVPISIAYADPGEPIHTVQIVAKFLKRDFPQAEEMAKVKLDFEFVAPLVEDGKPAYVPGL